MKFRYYSLLLLFVPIFFSCTDQKKQPNIVFFLVDDLGWTDEYLIDRISNDAIQYIEQNKERLFFLYRAHFSVHGPIEGRPDDKAITFDVHLKPAPIYLHTFFHLKDQGTIGAYYAYESRIADYEPMVRS
jgi:hypothetical protein